VARLRIVRAHLREVPPALKAGDFAKARKSFQAFDANWDSIEDLIKARKAQSYVAIEKCMIEIETALEPGQPDVAKVTALVTKSCASTTKRWQKSPKRRAHGSKIRRAARSESQGR